MKVQSTYSLVLDTIPMSFSLLAGATRTEAIKEHKKWLSKIKKGGWVTVPHTLPVYMNTSAFIALRVVEVTPEEERMHQLANDPRMDQFLNKSRQIVSENTDMGYK